MYLYIRVHPCTNEVVGILDSDSKVFMRALCVYVYIYMCTHTTYKCMKEIVVILDSEYTMLASAYVSNSTSLYTCTSMYK